MKPFNEKLAKSGDAVCTRDGRPVRFLKRVRHCKKWHLLVEEETGVRYRTSLLGEFSVGRKHCRDLFMGVPAPVLGEWIFQETFGQHGHRCSVCGDWVNYDAHPAICQCNKMAPCNPLCLKVKFLESALEGYKGVVESLTSLVEKLQTRNT